MMQLARRASAIVVLLLLASAGAASAECAWVLWEEGHSLSPDRPKQTWPGAGFVTKADCDGGREQKIAALLTSDVDGVRAVLTGEGVTVMTSDPRTVVLYTFVCLPDTVDPRGPKGGP